MDVVGLGVSRFLGVGAGIGCSVGPDDQLYCWGGFDDADEIRPPTAVSPTGVTGGWAERVALNLTNACALGTTREAYCWGSNSYGQLGAGVTEGSSTVPERIEGISDANDVVPAVGAACSLLADGTVACWGRADYLGAGLGTADAHPSPVAVDGLTDVVAIDGGSGFCAVHGSERRVSCWGDVPIAIAGVSGGVDVAVGISHGCAVLEDGTVMCWGNNDYGQLGDGTTNASEEAVLVVGLR